MGRQASLLETLKGSIERTYGMDTGIDRIDRYVVGDRGLRLREAGAALVAATVGSGRPLGRDESRPRVSEGEARLLVRQQGERVSAVIYYPDALIDRLERRSPWRGLDETNIDDFGVFVEELDHLLTVADFARVGREVSLLDLELHANVTKFYAAKHFIVRMSGRPKLDREDRRWLVHHLFEKVEFDAAPPAARERYREAGRLATRYLARTEPMPPQARLAELREFHRRPSRHAVSRVLGRC